MIIGCPKEIKTREYRVGLVPGGVATLTGRGHQVLIEKGAGLGSGIPDAAYEAVGAKMVDKATEVWSRADMIVKVKEPIASEYGLMKEGQTVYTYFHLAADKPLTKALLERKIAAVAYETIQTDDGQLPLLKPMSEVAGRMAVQVGALHLQKEHGGKGILLPGVPGVRRGKVVILGGGVVGTNSRRTWCTAWSTTAWPTCRARSRRPALSRLPTPPSATGRSSPTWGWWRPSSGTRRLLWA